MSNDTLPRCTDRADLLPPHEDYHIFPNTPIFSRLLRHAYRNRLAIRDDRLGVEKTYTELLSDALSLRHVLRGSLDQETLRRLQNDEEVYIGVLAPGGYEFAVAMLAIIAIGAAAVPMGKKVGNSWFGKVLT
jgi:malonyl-CoA/methylmalonyl-CoA synthetase